MKKNRTAGYKIDLCVCVANLQTAKHRYVIHTSIYQPLEEGTGVLVEGHFGITSTPMKMALNLVSLTTT